MKPQIIKTNPLIARLPVIVCNRWFSFNILQIWHVKLKSQSGPHIGSIDNEIHLAEHIYWNVEALKVFLIVRAIKDQFWLPNIAFYTNF